MFERYLTPVQICTTFAPYKIGDKVTLLKTKRTDTGIASAGSILTIKSIRLEHLPEGIPDIAPSTACDHYIDFPERVFIYTCEIATETPQESVTNISCYGSEFYHGELESEHVEPLMKERAAYMHKLFFRRILKAIPYALLISLVIASLFYVIVGFVTTDFYTTVPLSIYFGIVAFILDWIYFLNVYLHYGAICRKRKR